ncbi:N-acetyltransferase family protein, partial [Klebsiella quasipneumoniae]
AYSQRISGRCSPGRLIHFLIPHFGTAGIGWSMVRSDLKGLGLGRRLLEKLIAYTQSHGLQRLNGITMPNNRGMIGLARKLGFTVDIQLEDGIVSLSLPLNQG